MVPDPVVETPPPPVETPVETPPAEPPSDTPKEDDLGTEDPPPADGNNPGGEASDRRGYGRPRRIRRRPSSGYGQP